MNSLMPRTEVVSVTILKDSSESSAAEDELIDAKNRGGLCHHTEGFFRIFSRRR